MDDFAETNGEVAAANGVSSSCASPAGHNHFVQFYKADSQLFVHNVGMYLAEGLRLGQSVLVVATPAHAIAFGCEIVKAGEDPMAAIAQGRLLFLDADRTLGRFMLDDVPDAKRFEDTVRSVLNKFGGRTRVRAYGEMVGLLWERGSFSAAIHLEELWNKLIASEGFNLFCAYPIDIFDREFQVSGVDAILCDHTHLLPSCVQGVFEGGLERAMDEVLAEKVRTVRTLMTAQRRPSWAEIPPDEGRILWIRNNLPNADAILDKAREYYRASYSDATPYPAA